MSNDTPPMIDSDALAKLQAWQGRSETLADDITAAPVRALQWFSGLAFAVYCLHEPFLRILEKSTDAGHPWAGLLGYALATLGAAWAVDGAERKWKGQVAG